MLAVTSRCLVFVHFPAEKSEVGFSVFAQFPVNNKGTRVDIPFPQSEVQTLVTKMLIRALVEVEMNVKKLRELQREIEQEALNAQIERNSTSSTNPKRDELTSKSRMLNRWADIIKAALKD